MHALLLAVLFPVSAPSAEIVITKTQFVDGVKTVFPDSFCADSTYFRKCFSAGKDACTKGMKVATNGCLEKLQAEFPPNFKQPSDGQAWGEKIGSCVGEKFEEDQARNRLKTADCGDITKWTNPPKN